MKQKKYGKKVINWHRPFRSFQLSQRYLRLRYKDPEEDLTDHEEDDPFDPYGDDDPYWNTYNTVDGIDYVMHKLWILFYQEGQGGQLQHLLSQMGVTPSAKKKKLSIHPQTIPDEHLPIPDFLEKRLIQHTEHLANAKSFEEWIPPNIRAALFNTQENLECLQNLANDALKEKKGLILIGIFSPFWIRRPSTWIPQATNFNDRFLSLVEHLFIKYPVPACLYEEWLGWPSFTRMKWIHWFILLGQGGSLYRTAPHFEWEVSKKFQYHFLQAPSNVTTAAACMHAEVKRLGGSFREFERLYAHRSFVIDPTGRSYQNRKSFSLFWKDTLQYLIQHRNAISDEESRLILDWAMHQYTEGERAGGQAFSWKGRSLQRVMEASAEYHREISRPHPYVSYVWKAYGWNWEWKDEDANIWSFVELTNGKELYNEGKAMRHCVATYASRCAAGYAAIVSLRYGEAQKVTLEVNPNTKKIVQARGRYNRLPRVYEQRIIDKWINNILNKKPEQDTNKLDAK